MKINFNVKYRTAFGQKVCIIGNHPALGNNNIKKAAALLFVNEKEWGKTITLNIQSRKTIIYQYVLKDERNHEILTEWKTRTIILNPKNSKKTFYLFDTWSAANALDELYATKVFDVFSFTTKNCALTKKKFTHQFEISVPRLKKDEIVTISGNISALNNWNVSRAVPMKKFKNNRFALRFDFGTIDTVIEYKYGIYNVKTDEFRYEQGENRYAYPLKRGEQAYINDEGFNYLTSDRFKGVGVAVPIFSLRSKQGLGIGEFSDLKLLGDWAKNAGIKLIQILPVYDTTIYHNEKDSSPYNIISTFALNPQYLNIRQLAVNMPNSFQEKIQQKADALNLKDKVSYLQVIQAKRYFIKRIFDKERKTFLKEDSFIRFFNKNRFWLVPYAVFCVLRDKNKTVNFTRWKQLAVYNEKEVYNYARENDAVRLYYFIQFHSHRQLSQAVDYLHKRGIALKGDLPIGVYRYSCETWMAAKRYHLHMQAGAPPDGFSDKGQNWEFPTYNWAEIRQNQFKWWKQRMDHLTQYFDSIRIDHVLGFFRIWQIRQPYLDARLGFFSPAIGFTIQQLKESLPCFNDQRFCQPFINEAVLDHFFGENKATVKKVFLENSKEPFRLKKAFNTQRKVFNFIEKNPSYGKLEQALFDLLADVLLIKEKKEYHPRYQLMHTLSYKLLDDQTKAYLRRLHENYFFIRNELLWKRGGEEKLLIIRRMTNLLLCGEDLGMVPDCVPETMKKVGILGLEIQRMPKDMNTEFVDFQTLSYFKVLASSSHDSSTLRAWLEEDPERSRRFIRKTLNEGVKSQAVSSIDVFRKVIQKHLDSPAMWVVFPIQDCLAISAKLRSSNAAAERINIPGARGHVWNYRIHLTLERLIGKTYFSDKIKQMIKRAGREN